MGWRAEKGFTQSPQRRKGRRRDGAPDSREAASCNEGVNCVEMVERLDVEFFFRFGYTLAACGEELSRTDP